MQIFSYSRNGFSINHTVDEHPDNFNFQMHVHPNCELYYFVSGKGYYTVEGNNYPLTPGAIMIMRGGETHKLHISDSIPYERITIHFNPQELSFQVEELKRIFYDRPLGKNNLVECADSSRRFILSCLNRLCEINKNSNEEEIFAYFLPVIYEISKNLSYSSSSEDLSQKAKNDSELVVKIIAYINEHLGEIKSLDEIEQYFYFSRSYLNRIFKNKTGSTIWNYIILKRLLNAQNEIKMGKSAAVAAAMNGFGDYSSFYRQYKNQFGTSPILDRNSKHQK